MIALLMVLPWIASLLDPGYAHAGNFAIGLMLTAFVSGAFALEWLYQPPSSRQWH